MKKYLKLTAAALMALTLVACGNNTDDNTPSGGNQTSETDPNAEMVNNALTALNVESTVTKDFTLVTVGAGNVQISWESNNAAIKIEGSNAVVTQAENDVAVTLKATATKGTYSNYREFNVTVSKKELPQYISISEALNAATGTSVTVRGVVTQLVCSSSSYTTPGGFYIADADAAIYVYGSQTAQKVALGDDVIVRGSTANYPTTVTYVTQLASPELVDVVGKNATVNFNVSSFEKKTVAEIAADTTTDSFVGKVYYMENIRINKYSTTYTTMAIYDYKDNQVYGSNGDPKINLYSGQGDTGMPEFDHLADYLDKPVNIIFAVNSYNSSHVWRGLVMGIVSAE